MITKKLTLITTLILVTHSLGNAQEVDSTGTGGFSRNSNFDTEIGASVCSEDVLSLKKYIKDKEFSDAQPHLTPCIDQYRVTKKGQRATVGLFEFYKTYYRVVKFLDTNKVVVQKGSDPLPEYQNMECLYQRVDARLLPGSQKILIRLSGDWLRVIDFSEVESKRYSSLYAPTLAGGLYACSIPSILFPEKILALRGYPKDGYLAIGVQTTSISPDDRTISIEVDDEDQKGNTMIVFQTLDPEGRKFQCDSIKQVMDSQCKGEAANSSYKPAFCSGDEKKEFMRPCTDGLIFIRQQKPQKTLTFKY